MAKNEVKENKQKKHYFKDMKAELKKVIWPTPKQTMNNTVAVIVFTLVIALIVFVLDLCFDSITKYGVSPLQEKIQSSYKEAHSDNTTDENTENTESNTENSDENATNIEVETNTEENTNTEAETNTNSENK